MTEATYEALTPVEAEAKVRAATNKVWAVQKSFREAGDQLVAARVEERRGRVIAAFDPECPKVERGKATVGDREAWIDKQIRDLKDKLFAAEIHRETCLEALRSARIELQAAMAINASVREAYRLAGAND